MESDGATNNNLDKKPPSNEFTSSQEEAFHNNLTKTSMEISNNESDGEHERTVINKHYKKPL